MRSSMEDKQNFMIETTKIIAGEKVDETGNSIVAGDEEGSAIEAGFVQTPVTVKAEIDMDSDSAAEDFQETLIREDFIEDEEVMVRNGSVDGDMMDEDRMEVDHVHVMENGKNLNYYSQFIIIDFDVTIMIK